VILAASRFSAIDVGLLAIVIVLLGGSALLSLAETGLVRTSKARARALVELHRRGAKSLLRLVEDPEQQFLAPVLLVVLICQLVSATLVGLVANHAFGAIGVVIATAFEVVVIFVVAEAVPKQWAVRHADRAALLTAPIVAGLISFPPVRFISTLLIALARLVTPHRGERGQSDVTESELLALADVAAAEDVIEHEERDLISSIIEFGDTIVREVMAPRPDIVAVEASVTIGEVLEKAMAAGLSRIPVYEGTVDDIIGIAYTRDLMRAVRDGEEHRTGRELCRPAHYVPETKRVAPLLREMQSQQFHLAVVVDEYGGTAGIVTLEEPMIEPLGERAWRVAARMSVDEVNDLLDTDLPVGDWDTVGGLLLHVRGQVPAEGEQLRAGTHLLVAERVQGRRVRTVRIEELAPRPAERGAGAGGDRQAREAT
jgi:CBS domain containing-hemolysin-like protein